MFKVKNCLLNYTGNDSGNMFHCQIYSPVEVWSLRFSRGIIDQECSTHLYVET